jgi:DNA-binding MarR family transcriptional regulator
MEETRQRLIEELTAAVRDYQRGVDAVDDAVARRLGVNRTDLRCLDVLFDGPQSAGQLADEAGVSPAAMTTALDRLERAGYVRRIPDPDDRRRVLVEVTPLARQAAWPLYAPLADRTTEFLSPYDDEQLALMRDYLRASIELLARHRQWLGQGVRGAQERGRHPSGGRPRTAER